MNENPAECNRKGCARPVSEVSCRHCLDVPDVDLRSTRTNVQYCSPDCQQIDKKTHHSICTERQEIRRIARFASLYDHIFDVERMTMFDGVVQRAEILPGGRREFQFRDRHCINAITVTTPLLAYLLEGLSLKIEEVDVTPPDPHRITLWHVSNDSTMRCVRAHLHTVVTLQRISPPSLSPQSNPRSNERVVLDASAPQYGQPQVLTTWRGFCRNRRQNSTGLYSEPFGFHYDQHEKALEKVLGLSNEVGDGSDDEAERSSGFDEKSSATGDSEDGHDTSSKTAVAADSDDTPSEAEYADDEASSEDDSDHDNAASDEQEEFKEISTVQRETTIQVINNVLYKQVELVGGRDELWAMSHERFQEFECRVVRKLCKKLSALDIQLESFRDGSETAHEALSCVPGCQNYSNEGTSYSGYSQLGWELGFGGEGGFLSTCVYPNCESVTTEMPNPYRFGRASTRYCCSEHLQDAEFERITILLANLCNKIAILDVWANDDYIYEEEEVLPDGTRKVVCRWPTSRNDSRFSEKPPVLYRGVLAAIPSAAYLRA
ncbi:hypothetical protein BDV95DRAFT_644369 [Massariosphaeria phaeospora]|uniref:MYND-type zinc finger protein samB n=1 Tax=Massariosphaeria phaeospora TaxID=100035 RepID=A0A7C8MXD4_9PLEO|nr:hypothetical protein BDV95DRAFT_644369 [Massariosphaeria phaeospora]